MFGHWPPVAGRGALHRFTIQLLLVLLPERNCLFLGRRFDNPTKFSLSLPTDVLQSWLCLYAWWAEVIHQNAGTGKTAAHMKFSNISQISRKRARHEIS